MIGAITFLISWEVGEAHTWVSCCSV